MAENKSVPTRVTEERIVEAPQTNLVLPKRFVKNIAKGDSTPSVKNVEELICGNTATVLITDFDEGADGQHLFVLGDGFTTVQNGAKIKTNTGADKMMAVDRFYHFVRFNNAWVEAA